MVRKPTVSYKAQKGCAKLNVFFEEEEETDE